MSAAGQRARPVRLSALDMINLAVETPAAPMTIGAVLILDGQALHDGGGQLALAAIRQAIERRLADAPPLRRVIRRAGPLAGRPVWVDDPAFRVDRHVLLAEVPPRGRRTGAPAAGRPPDERGVGPLDPEAIR